MTNKAPNIFTDTEIDADDDISLITTEIDLSENRDEPDHVEDAHEEKPAEVFIYRLFSALNLIDIRLKEIAKELMRLQPKKHGAIQLALNACGQNCLGCPHPKWLKWEDYSRPDVHGRNRKALEEKQKKALHRKGKWGARKINTPLQSLRRSGPFAENYEEVRYLITVAEKTIKLRQKVVKHLGDINRVLSANEETWEVLTHLWDE